MPENSNDNNITVSTLKYAIEKYVVNADNSTLSEAITNLTDLLNTLSASLDATNETVSELESTKADKDHTHDNYADKNHTHTDATIEVSGFMSADDKKKLNGLDPEATKVTIDEALSEDSINPVQNKVIKSALDGKADTGHNHNDLYANKTHSHTEYLPKADPTFTGTLTGTKLTGLEAPTVDADAANKKYVDDAIKDYIESLDANNRKF